MGVRREPVGPEVEYTLTFRVPDEHVVWQRDETFGDAVSRAATEMLLRFTNRYSYDFDLDPVDQNKVTVKMWVIDDPSVPSFDDQLGEALTAMERSLGQRCQDGEDLGTLRIELHSDKEMIDVLERHGYVQSSDRNGQVQGYLTY